jgi:hypothetical protein
MDDLFILISHKDHLFLWMFMINLLEVSVISFDLKLIVFNQQIMPYLLVVS